MVKSEKKDNFIDSFAKENTSYSNWKNIDNKLNFYNKIPQNLLETYSTRGGLSTGADIGFIWAKIKDAPSILEVGAGYGRVIETLLKLGYGGKITAIEQSPNLINAFEKKISNKCHIHKGDINTFTTDSKFNIILWLWSGISDFSPKEQLKTVFNLHSLLTPNGLLFLDTFPCLEKPANAILSKNQSYIITHANCTAHGYIPSPLEVKNYAKYAGFKKTIMETYLTDTGRTRIMYELQKG